MKDKIVRVELYVDSNVKMASVENMFASNPSRRRMWIKDLPKWIVSQLNKLRRLPEADYFMEGVGRRISATIFWVVKPPKEKKNES